MSEEDYDDFEAPKEFVERKRREGKKDHSKDKKRNDDLERRSRASFKRRIMELEEGDLEEDNEEYKNMWK